MKNDSGGSPPHPKTESVYFILIEIGDWEIGIVNKKKNDLPPPAPEIKFAPTPTPRALWPPGAHGPRALWPPGPMAPGPYGPRALWPPGPMAPGPYGPRAKRAQGP